MGIKNNFPWSFLLVFIMIFGSLLSGCADSSTHGTDKDVDVDVTFNVSGGSTVLVSAPLATESSSEQKQDAKGTATISPPIRLQLTEGGSTSSGEGSRLQDVSSQLKQKINSENPATTTTTTKTSTTPATTATTPAIVAPASDSDADAPGAPSAGVDTNSDDLDYSFRKTYSTLGVCNGNRQYWRIAGKGPDFGSKIKLVFSSGKKFTVHDTAHNCRDREDTCNRDTKALMYGLVFKPGIGPNGDGDSNTGTSHGGIYIHAPYGDTSKSVTMYYNKS